MQTAALVPTSSSHPTTNTSTSSQPEELPLEKPTPLPSYAYDSFGSDVASGKETSDGYESLASSGKGDGKPRKHHRKSSRTRSRQERTSKPKLSILNVCNTGDKMVECQLETHNHKMVTFKFDLDGDAPEEIAIFMVENGFILPIEKEIFIDQLKEIVDKAVDMLSEDMEAETATALGSSPQLEHISVGSRRESLTPGVPQPVYQQNVLHTGKRWFIICPVEENTTSSMETPSNGTTKAQTDETTTAQSPGSAVTGQHADSGSAYPAATKGGERSRGESSSTVSGGSGGYGYDAYSLCSPPIMSTIDPLLLASLSPTPLPDKAASGSAQPRIPQSQPAGPPPEPPSSSLRSSQLAEDPPGGLVGVISPILAAHQMAEIACATSMADEVPCCPLVMPLSLDVGGGTQDGSPLTSLPLQDSSSSSLARDAPPPSHPGGDRVQQSQVVLQQPFASVGGAKVPSLPQSPAQHGAGPGESDGDGRVGRGSFVDSTIKTLDEKLRNLLYQEYAPMYPSGSAAETPGSGTEYVQSPPGPESATGGSGNSTPGPMGEGRYRGGEQLPQIPERMDSLSTLSDSAVSATISKRPIVAHSVSCTGTRGRFKMVSGSGDGVTRGELKPRSWSIAGSPALPAGQASNYTPGPSEANMACTTIGRFAVVSTEDDVTLSTRNSRYSAPPDFYLDTPPSQAKRSSIPRAQTTEAVPADVTVHAHARFLSSDSGAESSPAKIASATPTRQNRSERRGSDLMKRAVAFLRRSGRSSSVQSSDSPSRAGGVQGSAYVSSDNDSEMEDSDMKKELHRLREKHLKEISELQANQRDEIELLYQRLGKAPPPGLGLSHTAPPTGRRRKPSKHKLKAGKLLSPLVQQFRNAKSKSSDASKTNEATTASLNGSPGRAPFPPAGGSSTHHPASSTSEPVQTQQPCSLKGSLSSDNIYAGLQGEGTGPHGPPVQGTTLKRLCLGKERGSRSGAGPAAASNQPQQQTSSSTPPPHQPVVGLAQAQANNSNNKTGTYPGAYVGTRAGILAEDNHGLVDDWSQEVLVVTRRPGLSSLSLSRLELWDQGAPQTPRRLASIAPSAPSRTVPGRAGPQLPLSWPMIDRLPSALLTGPSAGFHPGYMMTEAGPLEGLLPSNLGGTQWSGLLSPLSSRVFTFPAVPPAWGTPAPTPPYEPPDPKTRTI